MVLTGYAGVAIAEGFRPANIEPEQSGESLRNFSSSDLQRATSTYAFRCVTLD